jgi:hypothetical protein
VTGRRFGWLFYKRSAAYIKELILFVRLYYHKRKCVREEGKNKEQQCVLGVWV